MSQFLVKTLRLRVHLHPQVDPTRQYAYGFWHGKQFTPIMFLSKLGNCKHAGLVSTSGDGEILSTWLKKLGYHIVRGSSSRKAISGLVKLLAAAKDGYSVGIAADGPRGPRHEAKAGLSFLACKAGLQLIPLGIAYSRKWQFNKSWDKYQMPLPFAKIIFYFGEPITINSVRDVDALNKIVAQAINLAEQRAALLLQELPKENVMV